MVEAESRSDEQPRPWADPDAPDVCCATGCASFETRPCGSCGRWVCPAHCELYAASLIGRPPTLSAVRCPDCVAAWRARRPAFVNRITAGLASAVAAGLLIGALAFPALGWSAEAGAAIGFTAALGLWQARSLLRPSKEP